MRDAGYRRSGSGRPLLLGAAIGLAAGVSSGVLGAGGGTVMVPLLVAFAAFSQHEAHATSLAAIVPLAAAGATRFALDGSIDYGIAGLLALGAVCGAPLGARLMHRLAEGRLKVLFGVLLIAVAAKMLMSS